MYILSRLRHTPLKGLSRDWPAMLSGTLRTLSPQHGYAWLVPHVCQAQHIVIGTATWDGAMPENLLTDSHQHAGNSRGGCGLPSLTSVGAACWGFLHQHLMLLERSVQLRCRSVGDSASPSLASTGSDDVESSAASWWHLAVFFTQQRRSGRGRENKKASSIVPA